MTPNIQKNPTFDSIQETISYSKQRQDFIRASVKNITSEQRKSDTIQSIQKHLRPGVLQNFFINHPHLWHELCNILRSGTTLDNENLPVFKEQEYGYAVYSLFLIRNREEDIGNNIMRLIRHDIFLNTELLKHAQRRPSILDSGSHVFDYIKKDARSVIEACIVRGLTDNVE